MAKKEVVGFDLADLKPKSDVVEVELVHPATMEPLTKNDGSVMTVVVYAPHSKEYKAALHEQTNKRIQKSSKGKRVTFTAEDIEQATLELLAKTTKSWDVVIGGKTPELSVPNAVDFYRDFPWVREQVEEAVNDSASFLKA